MEITPGTIMIFFDEGDTCNYQIVMYVQVKKMIATYETKCTTQNNDGYISTSIKNLLVQLNESLFYFPTLHCIF